MSKRWTVGLVAAILSVCLITLAQTGGGEMSDEAQATALWERIQSEDYTAWEHETDAPAGFYEGNEPHGLILRSYMNPTSFEAAQSMPGTFPEDSLIVKENHLADGVQVNREDEDRAVEGFEGNLESVTVMLKVPGYNPDAGDWFWAKYGTDGSIQAAGQVDGCIGCHTQVADNDYVFDAQVTAESAGQ